MAGAIDWDRIEIQYRAGIMTLREIAAEHGITHGSINKRAKRDGWARDLAAKIQAKAAALVSRQEAEAVSRAASSEARLATEREIVDAGAQKVADVLVGHKRMAAEGLELTGLLMSDLRALVSDRESIDKLGEMMKDPEATRDRMYEAFQRVIGHPATADTLVKISTAMKNFVAMQREAYGIVAEAPKPVDTKEVDKEDLARRVIFLLSQRLSPT